MRDHDDRTLQVTNRDRNAGLARAKDVLLVVSLATCVFLMGRLSASATLEAAPTPSASPRFAPSAAPALKLPAAQGRSTKRGSTASAVPLVYESGGGAPSSADGFIAVTGSYGVGTSVLYLVDTQKRQLAVYEARGGSQNSRKLTLVGARRIDLDLELEGYNDESEWSYGALRSKFEKAEGRKGATTPAKAEDAAGDGDDKK